MRSVSYFQQFHYERLRPKHAQFHLSTYRSSQHLQWRVGNGIDGIIYEPALPYSLAAVNEETWLTGDEKGRVWILEGKKSCASGLDVLVELNDGIAEITAHPQHCEQILLGDMRGQVSYFDLHKLDANDMSTFRIISGHQHLGPIKYISWLPNQERVFASGSQDGSCLFSDLRNPQLMIGSLPCAHANVTTSSSLRSTMTGLAFHPSNWHYFYTTGTPDSSIKLWDMRMLSTYSRASSMKRRDAMARCLQAVETFAIPATEGKRPRSSTALAIDSTGSRLFLSTSNDW